MDGSDDDELDVSRVDMLQDKLKLFLLATFFKYDMTSYDATLSSPLVGSSRKRILGEVMS
jgi:hypothetical protein